MWPMMACVITNIRSVPSPNASELIFTVSMNVLLFAKSNDSNMHVPITMKVKLIYGVSVANKNSIFVNDESTTTLARKQWKFHSEANQRKSRGEGGNINFT